MRLLISCFLFIIVNLSIAAPPINNPLNSTTPTFDVKDANRQFDQINLKLSVQNLNLETLNSAVKLLSNLVDKADDCININEKRLNTIDNQIQQATNSDEGASSDNHTSDADKIYLNNERKKLAGQQAQCRLFSIRAKDAIDAYKTAVAKLKHEAALTRGLPLWSIVEKINDVLPEQEAVFTITESLPPQLNSLSLWTIIFSTSLLISGLILLKIYKSKLARHYLRIKALKLSHLILLTLSLMCAEVALYLQLLVTRQIEISPLLIHITTITLFYLLGLVMIVGLFKVKKIRTFFYWYSLDNDFFRCLIVFLLSFYAFSLSAQNLSQHITISPLLRQFSESIFLLVVILTAICFVYYFCRAHRHISFVKSHNRLIKYTCTLLFIGCGILNALGYHTLSIHLTFAGISTFAIIFTTILIEHAISKLYELCIQDGTVHDRLIQLFGYKKDHALIEFLILKTTTQIIVFALALYLISQSFGYASYYIESAYTQFLYGIHFSTFTFYPTRIVAGVIVFCLLYLLFRGISTSLSRHEQFEDEEETQVAIASILTYVGFAFAVISALLVAGFDFTGLAIVAGALSVGIGLGLQSIVNNFVSGIILLIEKPIKPGDRINVDGIEGIVKKIRVRSTQLTTNAREDIIVPNSDLITHRVTNYMYSDKYLSIHCEVGVAYDSDTELVRDLLLSVTNNHDEIIKTARNKPSVLFRSFGENALIFQLWFLIKDGNKKSSVRSDLHFEIDKLFREHNVKFAVPHYDINVKMSDIEPLINK